VQLPLNPIHRQPRLERIMSLEIREEEEDTATEISAMRPGNAKYLTNFYSKSSFDLDPSPTYGLNVGDI